MQMYLSLYKVARDNFDLEQRISWAPQARKSSSWRFTRACSPCRVLYGGTKVTAPLKPAVGLVLTHFQCESKPRCGRICYDDGFFRLLSGIFPAMDHACVISAFVCVTTIFCREHITSKVLDLWFVVMVSTCIMPLLVAHPDDAARL